LNPGGGEVFRTCPHRPWDPPSLLYNEYRVFPGVRKRPGRDTDPSTSSNAEVKKHGRAIPLLSIRAFVACEKCETYLHVIKINMPNICCIIASLRYPAYYNITAALLCSAYVAYSNIILSNIYLVNLQAFVTWNNV
jgi:hypothetical protein